jgi:hypothetical protein
VSAQDVLTNLTWTTKETEMKRIGFYALVISLAPLAALAETSWTKTGANGATSTGTVDCAKGEGAITCTRDAELTTPGGKLFDRDGTRILTSEGSTLNLTTTGSGGRTITVTRERNWRN